MMNKSENGNSQTGPFTPHPLRIRRKGIKARLPKGAKLVGSRTRWANPFQPKPGASDKTRREAIEKYRDWLNAELEAGRRDLSELKGRQLACYCPLDVPCHADLLATLANGDATPEPKSDVAKPAAKLDVQVEIRVFLKLDA